MISLSVKGNLVSVTVMGVFSLEDYKEFEEAVHYGIKFQGVVNVLFDLRDMLSFSVDVAWEELKFSHRHSNDFGRIAILTVDEWVAWSTWINRLFVKSEIRLFDDLETAQAWLADTALAKA
ncbi:MAG: STAS/SEC14 domain-containing protein [Thiobacillaceae bacterium]